jgi:hypothetical protein
MFEKWIKLSFETLKQPPICPREREFSSGRLHILNLQVYKIELLHPSSKDHTSGLSTTVPEGLQRKFTATGQVTSSTR